MCYIDYYYYTDEYGEYSVINKQYLRSVYTNMEKYVASGILLKELCLLRDEILTTGLSRSDICHLIDFICTGWFYACFVSFCKHCSAFNYKLLYCMPCIKYKINFILLLSFVLLLKNSVHNVDVLLCCYKETTQVNHISVLTEIETTSPSKTINFRKDFRD